MYIGKVNKITKEDVTYEGVKNTKIQWLLGPKDEVPHFYMRYVTVEPGGIIPLHEHTAIHEMYIVKGKGAVLLEGEQKEIEAGDFVYMDSERIHGTLNTGEENLEFICCINKE